MSRRPGHIRRRGSNWEIRWRINGKIKTETFKGTLKAAEKRLREVHDLADRGMAPAKDTCAAWFDIWLDATKHELSPITAKRYRLTVKTMFVPHFGTLKLAELNRVQIRQAWAALSDRLAPSSIWVAHRALSACLSYAVEAGLIAANPCANWRGRGLPKVPHQEQSALNSQALADLIDAARGHPIFAPVIIATGTGGRRAEISALVWSDVDMTTGIVTISKAHKELSAGSVIIGPPKGGRGRKIRLPTSYLELLAEWRRTQAEQLLALGHRVGPDDYICTDKIGRLMAPNRITDAFRELAKRCRISATFHTLRHSHASLLLAAGTDIKTVQTRLGHSTASITLNVYGHQIPGNDKDEAERLDRALRGLAR